MEETLKYFNYFKMSPLTEFEKIRYKKPLESLRENPVIKGILSIIAYIWTVSADIIHTVGDMLNTPVELVLLLAMAIIADVITGVKAAKDNGQYIRSIAMRQTTVKIIEYGLALMILAGMANVLGDNNLKGWVGNYLSYLKNIHWLGYFWFTFSEFKSAFIENLGNRDGTIASLIDKIDKHMFNKNAEDIVEKED